VAEKPKKNGQFELGNGDQVKDPTVSGNCALQSWA
jgi:hypothetical protein